MEQDEAPWSSRLDLTSLPLVYVLATHLSVNEQRETEELLRSHGATLTNDIHRARVVLGNVSRPQRAKLELIWKGLRIQDDQIDEACERNRHPSSDEVRHVRKKQKTAHIEVAEAERSDAIVDEDSSTLFETSDDVGINPNPISQLSISEMLPSPSDSKAHNNEPFMLDTSPDLLPETLTVVKLDWLEAAVSANHWISMKPYIILDVRTLAAQEPQSLLGANVAAANVLDFNRTNVNSGAPHSHRGAHSIIERAKADPKPKPMYSKFKRRDRVAEAAKPDIVGKTFSSSQVPTLLRQTTSEDNEIQDSTLPPMPAWVLQNKIYSCERSTPLNPPNADFIQLLKKIRLARELTLDEIGVRAYSTSIASVSAYPHRLRSSREVLALPGCDAKIAHLFHEYHTTGQLQAIRDIEASPSLTSLQEFHEIWGVGAVTAREFYYEKGWRDLDDIIEHGWKTLTRVQQIGLKYYDEFQIKLTRTEVEAIADTITHHATLVTDDKVQSAIVGGYRRGQLLSSDVDIILSHPDESQTLNLVSKVVTALESAGYITHTLTLNLTTSHRNQTTLPIHPMKGGHGFDTLDKALVVWQSPHHHPPPSSPSNTKDPAKPHPKNPNPHHRVDIIISPWRTIGCAVSGWTSGTTFQRDLRRYCKHTKGWKFDSSGVRDRATGQWVDLEGFRDEKTRCRGWEEAEKRVFEGLGLEWIGPEERCTG